MVDASNTVADVGLPSELQSDEKFVPESSVQFVPQKDQIFKQSWLGVLALEMSFFEVHFEILLEYIDES